MLVIYLELKLKKCALHVIFLKFEKIVERILFYLDAEKRFSLKQVGPTHPWLSASLDSTLNRVYFQFMAFAKHIQGWNVFGPKALTGSKCLSSKKVFRQIFLWKCQNRIKSLDNKSVNTKKAHTDNCILLTLSNWLSSGFQHCHL